MNDQLAHESIFVTPRIVDQKAFEQFSDTLKGIVRDAAGQSRTLLATTTEVKTLGDHLRTASKELQGRVETAVRVIPTIDQRVQRAETLADQISKELTAKEQRVAALVEHEVTIDPARVREQVESIVATMIREQLGVVRDEFARQTREVVEGAIREVESAMTRMGERVREQEAALDGILVQAQARAERVLSEAEPMSHEKLKAAEVRLQSIVERADGRLLEILADVPEKLQGIEQRVDTVAGDIERRLVRFRRAADDIVELASSVKPTEVAKQMEAAARAAKAHASEHEQLIGERLSAALERAEQVAERTELAVKRLEDAKGQADLARKMLGEVILNSTEGIDAIEARLGETKETIEEISTIAEREREEAEAVVTPLREGLTEDAIQLATWLHSLIGKGSEVAKVLEAKALLTKTAGKSETKPRLTRRAA